MDGRVALVVDPIIMRVNQVALNVVECLHFDTAHLFARAGAHRGILSSVDKLADREEGDDAQVFDEHKGAEGNGQSTHAAPLKSIADGADDDHHGNGQQEELNYGLDAEKALQCHNIESDLGNVETNTKAVMDHIESRKQL